MLLLFCIVLCDFMYFYYSVCCFGVINDDDDEDDDYYCYCSIERKTTPLLADNCSGFLASTAVFITIISIISIISYSHIPSCLSSCNAVGTILSYTRCSGEACNTRDCVGDCYDPTRLLDRLAG